MPHITSWFDRFAYRQYTNNWDDLLFRNLILSHVTSTSTVLDLGAGAGVVPYMNFKGLVSQIYGVDLDPRILNNTALDQATVSDICSLPYEDESFDVVFSDNVMEHLARPLVAYQEVSRVLKPGGVFLFKTPNKWHYMAIISRLTPLSVHASFNQLRGRHEADTFPTFYRSNTKRAIQLHASQSAMSLEKLSLYEGRPEYLRFSWFTYFLGFCYERLVNSSQTFSPLRIVLLSTLRKPISEA